MYREEACVRMCVCVCVCVCVCLEAHFKSYLPLDTAVTPVPPWLLSSPSPWPLLLLIADDGDAAAVPPGNDIVAAAWPTLPVVAVVVDEVWDTWVAGVDLVVTVWLLVTPLETVGAADADDAGADCWTDIVATVADVDTALWVVLTAVDAVTDVVTGCCLSLSACEELCSPGVFWKVQTS